jgi:hypothetical protein
MRVLYVLESRDETGVFQPIMGLGSANQIDQWTKRHLSPAVLEAKTEWRIIKYGPLEPDEQPGPVLFH